MFENPIEIIARSYFESEKVVSHYFCEGHRVGLWQSEKALFTSLFSKTDRILDLGCGAGRIAFGLVVGGALALLAQSATAQNAARDSIASATSVV